MRHLYYRWDRQTDQVVPCSMKETCADEANFESTRRVAKTEVRPGVIVYTSFLAINHQWGSGPPIVFETMIERHGTWDDYQERYATAEEARKGHERIVQMVREEK